MQNKDNFPHNHVLFDKKEKHHEKDNKRVIIFIKKTSLPSVKHHFYLSNCKDSMLFSSTLAGYISLDRESKFKSIPKLKSIIFSY